MTKTIVIFICDKCGAESTPATTINTTPDRVLYVAPRSWLKGYHLSNTHWCDVCSFEYKTLMQEFDMHFDKHIQDYKAANPKYSFEDLITSYTGPEKPERPFT